MNPNAVRSDAIVIHAHGIAYEGALPASYLRSVPTQLSLGCERFVNGGHNGLQRPPPNETHDQAAPVCGAFSPGRWPPLNLLGLGNVCIELGKLSEVVYEGTTGVLQSLV